MQRNVPSTRAEAGQTHPQGLAQDFGDLVHGLEVVVWERGPASCQFTFVSRHAEDMLGYPLDRWLEPDFWIQLIHGDDRERVLVACRTAVDAADHLDYEYRALAADGRVVWMREILHVVCDETGQARSLRGV